MTAKTSWVLLVVNAPMAHVLRKLEATLFSEGEQCWNTKSLPSAHPMKQLDASARVPSQAACESSTLGEIVGFVAHLLCCSDACTVCNWNAVWVRWLLESACRKPLCSDNGGGGRKAEVM